MIGLIGIVGIAGALMANNGSRMADKGLEQSTTLAGAILMLPGWLCLWPGGQQHLVVPCWAYWWSTEPAGPAHQQPERGSMHWRPKPDRALNALYDHVLPLGALPGTGPRGPGYTMAGPAPVSWAACWACSPDHAVLGSQPA